MAMHVRTYVRTASMNIFGVALEERRRNRNGHPPRSVRTYVRTYLRKTGQLGPTYVSAFEISNCQRCPQQDLGEPQEYKIRIPRAEMFGIAICFSPNGASEGLFVGEAQTYVDGGCRSGIGSHPGLVKSSMAYLADTEFHAITYACTCVRTVRTYCTVRFPIAPPKRAPGIYVRTYVLYCSYVLYARTYVRIPSKDSTPITTCPWSRRRSRSPAWPNRGAKAPAAHRCN